MAGGPVLPGDSAPTGVRRCDAAQNGQAGGASTANVAVIDTGIDLGHPDLNAVAGTNCVNPDAPPQDDHGHGPHVAGTIAAPTTGPGVAVTLPGPRSNPGRGPARPGLEPSPRLIRASPRGFGSPSAGHDRLSAGRDQL